jgi:hypothetical protein
VLAVKQRLQQIQEAAVENDLAEDFVDFEDTEESDDDDDLY